MFLKQNIVLSYKKVITNLLESSSDGLSTGFNVYDEDQLRNQVTPTSPYVYVIQAHIKPTEITLPFIGIQCASLLGNPIEMGRSAGHRFIVQSHVFGRSRGQRDDIASYLVEEIADITIYDWSDPDNPSGLGTAKIQHDLTVVREIPIPADESFEGSWRNRAMISQEFRTAV